jgi:hypothetical protein
MKSQKTVEELLKDEFATCVANSYRTTEDEDGNEVALPHAVTYCFDSPSREKQETVYFLRKEDAEAMLADESSRDSELIGLVHASEDYVSTADIFRAAGLEDEIEKYRLE